MLLLRLMTKILIGKKIHLIPYFCVQFPLKQVFYFVLFSGRVILEGKFSPQMPPKVIIRYISSYRKVTEAYV